MRSTSACSVARDRCQAAPALERASSPCSAPGPDPRDGDVAAAGPLRDVQLPGQHHVQGIRLVSLPDQRRAGRKVDDLGHVDQPQQQRVVEAAEQRRGTQPLEDGVAIQMLVAGVAHSWARYWWTNWTAIAPSPTALAIRFTDRWRTSPAANTPGMLDSSR